MLWVFLAQLARATGVDRYADQASGVMARNDEGRMAMTEVVLRPQVSFSGARLPDNQQLHALHHLAHEECFIANSVKTQVRCEPVL